MSSLLPQQSPSFYNKLGYAAVTDQPLSLEKRGVNYAGETPAGFHQGEDDFDWRLTHTMAGDSTRTQTPPATVLTQFFRHVALNGPVLPDQAFCDWSCENAIVLDLANLDPVAPPPAFVIERISIQEYQKTLRELMGARQSGWARQKIWLWLVLLSVAVMGGAIAIFVVLSVGAPDGSDGEGSWSSWAILCSIVGCGAAAASIGACLKARGVFRRTRRAQDDIMARAHAAFITRGLSWAKTSVYRVRQPRSAALPSKSKVFRVGDTLEWYLDSALVISTVATYGTV